MLLRVTLFFELCAVLCTLSSLGGEEQNQLLLPKSKIFVVECPDATQTYDPQPTVIKRMVQKGLRLVTGKTSIREAWLSKLSTNDVVGLKVYSSPGGNAGTRPAVVAQVIESLLEAGFSPQHLIVWDRRISDLRLAGYFELAEKYQVRVAGSQEAGYDPEVFYSTPLLGNLVYSDLEFGQKGQGVGRKSYVSKLLTHEITKIVNITPLLNHNQAGVSGALYSLTMGSIDNVLRFEMDEERLATAIPEVYALPQVGDKVVLNIVDALMCQYQGEERTLLHYASALNQLWFSFDPVALDVMGIEEIRNQRKRANIAQPRLTGQIYKNCALLDLGVADPDRIMVQKTVLK
jgi:hypothetical protein